MNPTAPNWEPSDEVLKVFGTGMNVHPDFYADCKGWMANGIKAIRPLLEAAERERIADYVHSRGMFALATTLRANDFAKAEGRTP